VSHVFLSPCQKHSSISRCYCMSTQSDHPGLRKRLWKTYNKMAGSVSIRKALQLPFGSKRRENQPAPADQDPHETSHFEADAEFPRVSPHVDPTEWFPHYRNCVSHFVNVAQHTAFVQALAAFLNIHLPYQKTSDRDTRLSDRSTRQPEAASRSISSAPISLIPYIRRLVVTATDTPSILHRFFGEEWNAGLDISRLRSASTTSSPPKAVGGPTPRASMIFSRKKPSPSLSLFESQARKRLGLQRLDGVTGLPWKIGWLVLAAFGKDNRELLIINRFPEILSARQGH